jgi:hypothetical protein
MFLCLRVDLDYVPWDTPDAQEFGHGEPAVLLRMLDLARHHGYKYHFFASNRAMRAFPSNTESVLNEGHDLDWLCKHPENPAKRFEDAVALFALLGHESRGMAIRGPWPATSPTFEGIESFQFLSAHAGFCPPGLKLFPIEVKSLRDGVRAGMTVRAWSEAAKTHIRDAASRNRGATIVVRPQVLSRFDPKLTVLKEIVDIAVVAGLRLMTLREALTEPW